MTLPFAVGRVALLPIAVLMVLTACNGGQRPYLVDANEPTPLPEIDLEVPPAPAGTLPLPAAGDDFPLEASVDDALIAWSGDRNVPYTDSCALVTPGPGELCHVETEHDTIRLLGPSADESWYIVTVLETSSFDFGTGYRVTSVDIIGN